VSAFDTETLLIPAGENRWTVNLTSNWNIGDNPNGGYLLAPVVRAMGTASGHPDPLSVTTHYLRPGTGDAPASIEVETIRQGRTIGTVRGRLVQDGKTRLESIASFTTLGQPPRIEIGRDPFPVPDPDDCVKRQALAQGVDLPIASRIDIRIHPDLAEAGSGGSPEMAGWIRFADERPVDAMALTLFADAFPPSLFTQVGQIGWVPTIELTVQVRRRPVEGWIRGHFVTSSSTGNTMIEDGTLWDADGNVVAQSRQVGMLLAQDPPQ